MLFPLDGHVNASAAPMTEIGTALEASRPAIHLALHVLVPGVVAWWSYRATWRRAWLWLLAGWMIDVDHLLADPAYVPDRCSVGFHPLHRWPAALAYAALAAWQRTRLLGLGLLIHLALDLLDCLWMGASP